VRALNLKLAADAHVVRPTPAFSECEGQHEPDLVLLRGRRLAGTIAFQACALVVLGSCSSPKLADSSPSPEAVISEATLLPPAAYFLVLDSSLLGAHPEKHPTFVHGALPMTRADLQARHLRYREDPFVCPGEAALWFLPPVHRADGTTELEVVEAFGNRGLAGSRVFVFRCSNRMCRLVRALPGDSDRLVVCGRRAGH
jgi:hypothetical protein